MSDRAHRLIGVYAAASALVALLLAPLLALSYFATSEGAKELERGTVAAWAEPTRDAVGGLVTWASAERVYSTYVQIFALIFAGVVFCALAVRSSRRPAGGNERWGWRIAIVGYALAGAGLLVVSIGLAAAGTESSIVNVAFLFLLLPGMFLSVIGSTVLGIAFLRNGYRPRLTSLLLTLALPSMVAMPTLLGHNSLGMLPLIVAWGATGLRMWRESARSVIARDVAADVA